MAMEQEESCVQRKVEPAQGALGAFADRAPFDEAKRGGLAPQAYVLGDG